MITDHIAELEWGSAPSIGFTFFDSCLGLLGRSGNDVIGVHLVMVASRVFDDEAAALAASVVLGCNEVAVIGNVSLWEDNVPGPFQAMGRLIGAWRRMTDRGRGTYGGRVNGGRIQYRFNGVWYNQ